MTATDEYFAAAGTAILRGRSIRADDRPGAPPVVLISESIARRLFPKGDAIGSRVLLERQDGSSAEQWRDVIGVVADVRGNVTSDASEAVYVSNWQEDRSLTPEFVVRVAEGGDAALLIPALRRMVHELNPLSPLIFPHTLSEVLHRTVAPQELSMTLFVAFAALALGLAALGVYAVMAYIVAARTREFGIRSALGARRGSLLMLVLRQGMLAALVGCGVGLILAAAATRLIERLLSGVSTHDAVTFVMAPVVLFAVTLAACLIPARAATRVQPVDALRAD
jgi:ABC-type antimicrobial peptide transport system permease subunit